MLIPSQAGLFLFMQSSKRRVPNRYRKGRGFNDPLDSALKFGPAHVGLGVYGPQGRFGHIQVGFVGSEQPHWLGLGSSCFKLFLHLG